MTLRPEIPASSTSPRSIRRGEFHPPGRSRTALESAKLELRAISADLKFRENYVGQLPLPTQLSECIIQLESTCVELKKWIVARDIRERGFDPLPVSHERVAAVSSVLHAIEGICERKIFAAYRVADDDLRAVLDETGTPSGWFPLIAKYDGIPSLVLKQA